MPPLAFILGVFPFSRPVCPYMGSYHVMKVKLFSTFAVWTVLLGLGVPLVGAATSQTNSPSACGIDARMMRYPEVSATQIAFVYAGDIWVAPKAGGLAERLSSPKGEETFPRFSPDGSQIAFSGNYDGNMDIYSMPVTGGLPGAYLSRRAGPHAGVVSGRQVHPVCFLARQRKGSV